MPRALEVLTGRVTFSNTAITALTMSAGDSLTVRNAPLDSRIMLLQVWSDHQAAGILRIRSPKLHDNVQGIRWDIIPSEVKPLMPWGAGQKLIAQDTLIVELSAADAAGDIESAALLLYYDNLPGTDARLMTWDDVKNRIQNIVTVENTLTTGAGGGYTGEEALNAEFDLLKANTDYALLGYLVDTECAAVGWRGADTGNLRVAGPGDDLGRDYTSDWFKRLSVQYGMPTIPVFNSANRNGILLDAVQDENAAAVTVTSIFAELGAAGAAR